jgi:hypothetical protein
LRGSNVVAAARTAARQLHLAAEMMKSFFLSKYCRNQLAPFDVLVEPPDGLPTLSL